MKRTMFTKGLSVLLAALMVFSAGIVGIAPIAEKANAEIAVESAPDTPVFNLKWNVPESIYLKPGSGDFQYFLTNTLTATGATAVADPATACDVTVVAPMADSMTLTYELVDGKKPDGTAASADGLSLNIANNVTGTQSITNTLTGKALTGYTDAIAGNEYFIKWTLTFKVTVGGKQEEYTEYAYTSVYLPLLATAGASLHSAYKGAFAYRAQNWAYTFITGGHTVSGGNYKSNFLSSSGTPSDTNLIAPLVSFTGGNKGKQREDVDNGFANGGTIPWSGRYYNNVTVTAQNGGGVYVAEKKHTDLNGWNLENTSGLGQANITIDGDRFTDFRQIPNLKVGMAQYRWDYDHDGENNRIRWIAAINPGASASYSDKDMSAANITNSTVEAVNFSCPDAGNDTSRALGLYALGNVNNSTILNGVYKILFNYRNVYWDGLGEQRNGVVACVNLNVTKVGKAALRNAVYEAYANGYAKKSDSSSAVTSYINAVAAADKVLADQFASAADITAALAPLTAAGVSDTKTAITNYYKEEGKKGSDYVAFNVPEAIYLTPTTDTSSAYQYVLDQTMSKTNETAEGVETGNHVAAITPNSGYKNISAGGNIQFYYADVDTTKDVTLTCSDSGVTFGDTTESKVLTANADGIYSTTVTAGSHAYSSGYITWYVNYTDKNDGCEKSVTAKTYVYAPCLKTAGGANITDCSTAASTIYTRYSSAIALIYGVHGITKNSYGSSLYAGSTKLIEAKNYDSYGVYKTYPIVNSTYTLPTYKKAADRNNLLVTNTNDINGHDGVTVGYGGARTENQTVGGEAYLYIDSSRQHTYSDIPNFNVGVDYLSINTTKHCEKNATYYIITGSPSATNTVVKWCRYKSGDTSNSEIVRIGTNSNTVADADKLSTQSVAGGQTVISYGFWQSSNNLDHRNNYVASLCTITDCNKTDLRTEILKAQREFDDLGIVYDGTGYDSLYYNKDHAAFEDFITAYTDAQEALVTIDENRAAPDLATALQTLKNAISAKTDDADGHTIKKSGTSKQYNVSYDADGDKILRVINNVDGKDTTFTQSYFAKDNVNYSAESYTGYDFLGFIKSDADLGYAGITGSQVMSGTPDYLTSAADYQNQAVTTSGFGATSAVSYPNTVPVVAAGSIAYSETIDENIYMIGVYQPHQYTVTYKANGGTGSDKVDTNVYGADYNFAANTFTKTNYNFVNWNTEPDGSGTSYEAGAALALADMPTEEGAAVTLYAQWQADPNAVANYTIKILVKNASGQFVQQGETITGTGVNGEVIDPSTAIDGYIFLASQSTALPYTLVAGAANAIELKYEVAEFTAAFKSADGSATLYTQTNVPVGTTPTFGGTEPTKSGYTETNHYKFAGWAQTANATVATGIEPMSPDGDMTYYAVFTTEAHSFTTNVVHEDDGEYTVYTCACGYIKSEFLKNHTWVLKEHQDATCSDPGYDYYECSEAGCNKTLTTDIEINPAAHAYVSHAANAATCEADGNYQYWTCSICGKFFSDQSGTETTEAATVIPAKGHDFTAKPTFNWSDDYTSCTATYTCKNDASHTEEKTCTVTPVTTPATCEVDGYIEYTAKVTFAEGHNEYSETMRGATINKLGHDFTAWAHTEGTVNADAKHSRSCKREGCTKVETTGCTFNDVVTPATFKDQGYTTHTCTVCGYSYVDTYTDPVGCKLTINYYFTGTATKAAESVVVENGVYGTDYSFTSPSVTGYTASQLSVAGTYSKENEEINVYYSANTNTAYKVEHYKQNADGAGYTLADTDNLTGTTGANTNATAKTYTGFTAKTVEQQTINADGSTVVRIDYDRDVYTVTWNVGDGATVNEKPASVLYGNDIDFTVEYDAGHNQTILPVTVTVGTLTGSYKVTNITGNVVVNVPTQINTYTVAVSGDAGVTVSDNATVNYNGSYTLTVTPKDNYKQNAPTATVNGETLALTKNGDVYTATLENITENKTIAVASTIDSYTLTVTYKYADNSEAAETVSKSVNVGADYSETCPAITKFVPVIVSGDNNVVTTEVKGTMGTSDVTVNIVYLADENENGKPDVDDEKKTVTFDYGRYGTAVDGQVYAVNVIPDTAYSTITKPTVNAKDGFTFAGWKDSGITTVTDDITVYASYTTKNENGEDITVDEDTYLVRFYNWDGELIKAAAAAKDATVTAPDAPTRGDFTFAGWNPTFEATVTGDVDYVATFKTAKTEGGEEVVIGENEYVVSFYTFDGELVEAKFVEAGKTTTAPAVPPRAGFTFVNWTNGGAAFDPAAAVNADASYTATYKTVLTEGGEEVVIEAGKYVIKFFTYDGELLESIVKGLDETFDAPEVPDRANTTSKFWKPDVETTVKGDANYTAAYKTKLDPTSDEETEISEGSYVISFYEYNDSLIARQIVAAGDPIEAPEAGGREGFSFAGWKPELAEKATQDASYKAKYSTKLNPGDAEETEIPDGYYVVTFKNYNGDLVEAQLVKDGETAAEPATVPTRENCTFKAWNPAFSDSTPVIKDTTYTATYTTKNEKGEVIDVNEGQYVVKFFNYNDDLIKCYVVDDGEKVTAPTAVRGSFTFAGWKPGFDPDAEVHKDASYKATFKTPVVPGGSEQIIPDGKYVVSFYTYTGRLIEAQFITAGLTASAPGVPPRANTVSAYWTPDFNKDAPVYEDADYTATYTIKDENGTEKEVTAGNFIVRFVDYEGKLLKAEIVENGKSATAPDMSDAISHFDETEHYGFNKWDKEFEAITADTTVNAVYGSEKHDLAEETVVEAGCLTKGSKRIYCTVCGYEKTVVIDALGHDEQIIPAVAPSCTETGLTEGLKCARCGKIITAQKTIAANGHSFGAWTIVKYATDTEDGLMKRVCSVCHAEETKAFARSDEYLVIEGGSVLQVGESTHIVVKRMPADIEENVTWTSSDPNIAFQDEDGNITVLGMGAVTLTAVTADGLTITKTYYINDNGNSRLIYFNAMEKMHYVIAGYRIIYNADSVRWSKDYALKFRVHTYKTFNFTTVLVRANGVEIPENADGSYTIPASEDAVIITVEGAGYDQETGEKMSFWEMLINFFNRIINFFKNLFK